MITKKTLVFICLILAAIYHFIFHLESNGPTLNRSFYNLISLLPLLTVSILLFIYLGTNWRVDLKGDFMLRIFDLMIIWIFICFFRNVFNVNERIEWREFLTNPYLGLSLFPALFFLVGINIKYFAHINLLLSLYCILSWALSLFFIKYSELQYFLVMPIFYMIVTFNLQKPKYRIITFIIALNIVILCFTNRAGVMRIIISYLIVFIFYIIYKLKLNKKLISVIIFCILMAPFYFIYLGTTGKNIFTMVLGDFTGEYSQDNLTADTRTFLYTEVFRDLKITKSFVIGKGVNGGYASYSFETLKRDVVEVGFLQILIKSGIVGLLIYMSLIISAIFKALNKSKNLFMEFLALLLAVYVLMFFIENILAFNLLNIVIWMIVGMCHSAELRGLNDKEIKELFLNVKGEQGRVGKQQ